MKKAISLLLTVLLLSAAAAPVFAADATGDVDADGAVTAADARLLLRAAVELEALSPEQRLSGDLDEDGVISAADARLALRLAVGLPLGETEEERQRREERERQEEERRRQEEEERRRQEEEEERRRQEEEEKRRLEEQKSTREGYMTYLAGRVSEEALTSKMYSLVGDLSARYIGTAQNTYAANWIVTSLYNYGFEDVRRWGFTYNGAACENIVGVLPAKTAGAQILLFVAHYDTHVTTGGAVDNSSGVALMMELARILASENRSFDYEIRFLFSSAEEQGYVGCYRYIDYVASYPNPSFSRHAFVFNADMAGAPTMGGPWYLAISTGSCYEAGTARSNWGSNAVDHAKALLGYLGEAGYYSPVAAGQTDIIPFRNNGLPCVNVSWRQIYHDRAHGSDYGLASWSYIHSWTDNLNNFNWDSLYNMTRLVAAAAGDMLY